MHFKRASIAFLAPLGALILFATAAWGAGTWPPLASMPLPVGQPHLQPAVGLAPPAPTGLSQTGVRLSDGRGLIVGEHAGAIYDPRQNSWSTTASMQAYRYGYHTATLLNNGNVLVVGGYGYNAPEKGAEVYSPSNDQWAFTGAMHLSRTDATATLLPDGRVLVAGGIGCGPAGSACVNTEQAEVYDPGTDTWTVTGGMAEARQDATATRLRDGRVLVAGGLTCCPFSVSRTAEIYNPRTGTWDATGAMTSPREYHTATLLRDGRVLVVGGDDFTHRWEGSLASAEMYDPQKGAWHPVASMSVGRRLHTATLLENGSVLVAGGETAARALDSAEVYNPAKNRWTSAGSMRQRRVGQSALLLRNGSVLMAGGNTLWHPNTTAELYRP